MSETEPLLIATLELAVPMWIEKVKGYTEAERHRRAAECAQHVAEHGDVILYRGKGTAEAFNALAEGLACAAFAPGGITVFDHHWEATP